MELESKVRDNVYKNTCPEVMISNLVVLGRVMGIIRHSNFNHCLRSGFYWHQLGSAITKKRGWIAPTSDPSRTVLMMPFA